MEFFIIISFIITLIGLLGYYWNKQVNEFYEEALSIWNKEEKIREEIILDNIMHKRYRIAFLNSCLPIDFYVTIPKDKFIRYFADHKGQTQIKYIRGGSTILLIREDSLNFKK